MREPPIHSVLALREIDAPSDPAAAFERLREGSVGWLLESANAFWTLPDESLLRGLQVK